MSADLHHAAHDHAGHGHDDHDAHLHEESHGSYKSYFIGFGLSVILTAIPFWLVMTRTLTNQATALIIMAFAAVQMVVHMNRRAEGGWSIMALIFTIVIVGIALSGSLWVMYHMNANMMPTEDMSQMG
jgi:cytochrome o ubiquinol oxidase operon protein cyoD